MSNTNATNVKLGSTIPLREDHKRNAARILVKAPLAMAALGAMLRGATGFRDMFTASNVPTPSLVTSTQTVPLPTLYRPGAEDKDEAETEKRHRKMKIAATPPDAEFSATNIPNWLAEKVYKLIETKPGESPSFIRGDGANNAMGVPMVGAALPLGVIGGYAGFKGMDAFLDSRRKAQKQEELDTVRKRYLSTLRGKYACDEDLNEEFDKTAEAYMEKVALGEPAPQVGLDSYLPGDNVTSHLGGQYAAATLAAMLTSGLGGGYLGYNFFSKNNRRKVMEEALRRRAAAQNDPAQPIYADVV